MAESIKPADAPKKRGRPSKSEIADRKRREAQAQAEIDAREAAGGNAAAKPAAAPKSTLKAELKASAFGHNQITTPAFLKHVRGHRQIEDEIAAAQLAVKAARGKKKDYRNHMKGDGIVLQEFDQAIEALNLERVDLLAQEERRVTYFEMLGLPTLRSAESAKIEKDPAQKWWRIGNIDGRLGEPRAAPEGCPPEHVQDYLHGYDKGADAAKAEEEGGPVDEGAPAPGSAEAAPEAPPEGAPEAPAAEPLPEKNPVVLILREEHFAAGTALDDANLKTLLAEHADQWRAAERVVVVMGVDGIQKKRILKEPAEGNDPAYEDTGEAEVELSEAEDAGEVTGSDFE